MELTSLLKEARKKKGFTQMEVGNAIGITAGAYSKIETGVNYLSIDHIRPLCDFLEIPTDLLVNAFYGEGGQMMVNICDKENGNMLLMAFESAKEKYPEHKEVFEGLNEVVKNRIIGFPFGSNEEEVNAYIDKFFERYKVSEKVMDTFLLSKALIKSIVYYLLETSNKEDQTVDSILKLLRYNLPDRHLSIRLVIGDVVIDKPVSETRSEKEEADDTSSVYGLLLDGLRYQNPASPALEPYEFFLSHSREKREEACLLAIYIVMKSKR